MVHVEEYEYCEIQLDWILRYYAEHAMSHVQDKMWDAVCVDTNSRRVVYRRTKPRPEGEPSLIAATYVTTKSTP